MFVKSNGGYEKVQFSGSINDFCYELGYSPDQAHTYFGGGVDDPKIVTLSVEMFTKNVLFVCEKEGIVTITDRDVERFLKDFDYNFEYSSLNIKWNFETGIENKTFKIDFLARVFSIRDADPNGMFYIPSIGYNLFFIDGYLTDFQASDGLNESAKHFKQLNPMLFRDYENEANRYWNNNLPKVINEVNKQFDALFWIPHAFSNEFISLHKNSQGFINFYMLKVCHYTKSVSLSDFLEINHGRCKEVKPIFSFNKNKTKKYSVGKFVYEFSDSGELIQFSAN